MFYSSSIKGKEVNLFVADPLSEDCKVLESPIRVNCNFMRNMEVPDDVDYYS